MNHSKEEIIEALRLHKKEISSCNMMIKTLKIANCCYAINGDIDYDICLNAGMKIIDTIANLTLFGIPEAAQVGR